MNHQSFVARRLALLVEAYSQLAVQLTHAEADRQDALQRAVEELLAAVPRNPAYCCDAEGAPSMEAAKGLLLARSRSRGVDELRRGARRRTANLEDRMDLASPEWTGPGSDEQVNALALREWRRAVEETLPAGHCEGWRALLLKWELGLESPEIAEVLGISPAAARQRMSRCVRFLREQRAAGIDRLDAA